MDVVRPRQGALLRSCFFRRGVGDHVGRTQPFAVCRQVDRDAFLRGAV